MFDQAAHTLHRRSADERVSARLAALDDQALQALIEGAAPLGSSLGGGSGLLELDGVRVFVKTVPLTDLERSAPNSTANLFELPLYYQYGVGSYGFGAWRELAANRMATDWVLGGECVNFPLLHHWRVLERPRPPAPTPKLQARLDRVVAYWNGSQAISARQDAMQAATATIVMFLEYVPETVNIWLAARVAEGGDIAERAVLMVDEQLNAVTAFINARGMLHFDLHFHNIMTDGNQLYVADFGLAICAGFALSEAERDFVALHQLYDRCYVASYIVHWIEGLTPPVIPTPGVAAIMERYRPVGAVMGGFLKSLRDETKLTPYPADALQRASIQADTRSIIPVRLASESSK